MAANAAARYRNFSLKPKFSDNHYLSENIVKHLFYKPRAAHFAAIISRVWHRAFSWLLYCVYP